MEFYSKDNNIDKILPIINGEHKVSLRLIDWFVTNYSKKYYTCYNISSNGNQRRFKVYVDSVVQTVIWGFLWVDMVEGLVYQAQRVGRDASSIHSTDTPTQG